MSKKIKCLDCAKYGVCKTLSISLFYNTCSDFFESNKEKSIKLSDIEKIINDIHNESFKNLDLIKKYILKRIKEWCNE